MPVGRTPKPFRGPGRRRPSSSNARKLHGIMIQPSAERSSSAFGMRIQLKNAHGFHTNNVSHDVIFRNKRLPFQHYKAVAAWRCDRKPLNDVMRHQQRPRGRKSGFSSSPRIFVVVQLPCATNLRIPLDNKPAKASCHLVESSCAKSTRLRSRIVVKLRGFLNPSFTYCNTSPLKTGRGRSGYQITRTLMNNVRGGVNWEPYCWKVTRGS